MLPDLPYADGVPDSSGAAFVRRRAVPTTRTRRLAARARGLLSGVGAAAIVTPLAVSLATVTATTLAPSAHADSLDRQKKTLDRQLSRQRSDLDGSSRGLARAAAALDRAEAALTTARTALADTRTELAAAQRADRAAATRLAVQQKRLAAAQAAVARGEADLAAQKRLTALMVSEHYQKQTNLMPFALLAQSGSLADFQSRVQLASTMLDASQVEFDRLSTLQTRLEQRRTAQAALARQVAADRAAAATALKSTRALEQRAANQAATVAALVRSRQTAKNAAAKAVAADRREYAALQRESAAVSRRIAARIVREKAARRAQHHSSPASSHHGFVYPVGGPITSSYGMRLHPVLGIWKLHDGTDFGAGCGTPIRAAYAGRVVERYDNAGYGNRLMIDHGRVDGRYVTTGYNHAIRYVVGVGQHVRQNQLIGYVGQTGYATGCHLHLMVWLDGSLTNPMTWY